MMSIERSGVRTWSAPRTSSQYVPHGLQGCLVVGRPPAPDQLGRRRGPVRLAEQHDDLRPRSGGELHARLERSTRVQRRPDGAPETMSPLEAGRAGQGTVAAEELCPIARPPPLTTAHVEERDPTAELRVPRVAGEDGPGLRARAR